MISSNEAVRPVRRSPSVEFHRPALSSGSGKGRPAGLREPRQHTEKARHCFCTSKMSSWFRPTWTLHCRRGGPRPLVRRGVWQRHVKVVFTFVRIVSSRFLHFCLLSLERSNFLFLSLLFQLEKVYVRFDIVASQEKCTDSSISCCHLMANQPFSAFFFSGQRRPVSSYRFWFVYSRFRFLEVKFLSVHRFCVVYGGSSFNQAERSLMALVLLFSHLVVGIIAARERKQTELRLSYAAARHHRAVLHHFLGRGGRILPAVCALFAFHLSLSYCKIMLFFHLINVRGFQKYSLQLLGLVCNLPLLRSLPNSSSSPIDVKPRMSSLSSSEY